MAGQQSAHHLRPRLQQGEELALRNREDAGGLERHRAGREGPALEDGHGADRFARAEDLENEVAPTAAPSAIASASPPPAA